MATPRASTAAPAGCRLCHGRAEDLCRCFEDLLRIKAPDSRDTKVDLSLKYGAHLEMLLLMRATQCEGLPLAGVQ
ncbi:hypothetical protein GUJ93_ZPchr0239g7015 [Zizania palustris]|uniref:Uncharacterized protein n=1 Tax=Zizania palustris TaxID=103762 RepID=A0A8J5UVC8_ZIZPA|nr:hypothetical protein GUJ93_ZPchr0239g7015 [Zizania palustris]